MPAAGPPKAAARAAPPPAAVPIDDPALGTLIALRSGSADRVRSALRRLDAPETLQVAQVVQLLAWDEVLDMARRVLERSAGAHVGLLIDELVNPDNDFAIRRRIPRVLGTLSSPRALTGLLAGLDDSRFEVRYQCSQAIEPNAAARARSGGRSRSNPGGRGAGTLGGTERVARVPAPRSARAGSVGRCRGAGVQRPQPRTRLHAAGRDLPARGDARRDARHRLGRPGAEGPRARVPRERAAGFHPFAALDDPRRAHRGCATRDAGGGAGDPQAVAAEHCRLSADRETEP